MDLFVLLSCLLCFLQVQARALSEIDVRTDPVNGSIPGIITYDKYSLSIRGERMFIFSGDFHPWRLPSPGLWLDVFQKIKAMGFNAVTFYTYWGLIEGTRGEVRFESVFALDEWFNAASEAGIYLIARPGPYINAETAMGGYPGWTARIKPALRGNSPEFRESTDLYAATLGDIIAEHQITNGGPVVMLQPENEYDTWPGVNNSDFPLQLNRDYMQYVKEQFRGAGVVVPQMVNDHLYQGNWAPGSGLGATDVYGIDAYPLRYDCADPDIWPNTEFPVAWQTKHEEYSPDTPFFVAEFQGGVSTGFGSVSQDECNALVNEEAVRVLWKNNYSFAIKIFNIYMTYGGTNWGNLGYLGGDSSYDYGAAIKEDRHVWREKYSEQKLEANFFKVSPAYLTAVAGNASNGSYVSTDGIATTPVFGTDAPTNFYIIRHADWTSTSTASYKLQVPTSAGNVSIPQLGGQLILTRRDSKIHVTDYDVGGVNLVYCTAEIFTWAKGSSGKRTLILYGGAGELHEIAVDLAHLTAKSASVHGNSTAIKLQHMGSNNLVIQWRVSPQRQVVSFGDELEMLLLWRNDAYNYWAVELPAEAPISNYSSPSKSMVVVNGGYLIRTAAIGEDVLSLTGDINATTDLELIYESTGRVKTLEFNGRRLSTVQSAQGRLTAHLPFSQPAINVPDFASLNWKHVDSLPEIQASYDDSRWTVCDHHSTNNSQALLTPTSLYASDYGYHMGSLLYRGHFIANGAETAVYVNVTGGNGFGYSLFLDSTHVASFDGSGAPMFYDQNISLATHAAILSPGSPHVLTLLIDHMGQDEEAPGTDAIKAPFGLINYELAGHAQADVTWKMTGNLGGENYIDTTRGPRNEGAMFAERQGFHQPEPPSAAWAVRSPVTEGQDGPGVGFYTTTFELHVPESYDAPMSFVFQNTSTAVYRCQLFVNGWQFGKYVANLGPQTTFPVPEGILNHNGVNTVAITLWAFEEGGAKLDGLSLVPEMPVWSGYQKPWAAPQPKWTIRPEAY
ncbi:glycoside hydrolase superfamily [Xylariaceae sp. FL0804]|nr:glycoside hydrolase superfamily [Xylariaceae sp. FL0804]